MGPGGTSVIPTRDPASMGSMYQNKLQSQSQSAGVAQHSTMQGGASSDYGRRNYRTPDRHMQDTMTSADLNQRMPGAYGGAGQSHTGMHHYQGGNRNAADGLMAPTSSYGGGNEDQHLGSTEYN